MRRLRIKYETLINMDGLGVLVLSSSLAHSL
jgi:hypothetical protein